jgi:hypothetical protein
VSDNGPEFVSLYRSRKFSPTEPLSRNDRSEVPEACQDDDLQRSFRAYSTVTDFARFRGLSTSVPFASAA